MFIGNSLTYYNNLPQLVIDEAAANDISVYADMIVAPNYALIDHWNDGKIQESISSGNYDFVIIQQGPSSQEFGREVLIEYGKKIQTLSKLNNSKLMYYMVWPAQVNYWTFDGVIKNHKDAAEINNALICPIGELWKNAHENNENPQLYGADGFHPSYKGSKFIAKHLVKCLID